MTRLKRVMNVWTLRNLRPDTLGPEIDDPAEVFEHLIRDGYEGLQTEDDDLLAEVGLKAGLDMSCMGRVLTAPSFRPLAARHKAMGFSQTTLHVGTGFESPDEAFALVEALLDAEAAEGYPLIVETHRATLTQDPRRTLDLVALYPQLTFNADISHWYAGCELPYGDLDDKLDRLRPVFDRVRYVHGRIADSSCLQVPVTDMTATPVLHFRDIWTRCFAGFLRTAGARDICFAPELLPNRTVIGGRVIEVNYARLARMPDGRSEEETDRWQQAGVLCAIAQDCFDMAAATID